MKKPYGTLTSAEIRFAIPFYVSDAQIRQWSRRGTFPACFRLNRKTTPFWWGKDVEEWGLHHFRDAPEISKRFNREVRSMVKYQRKNADGSYDA